MAVADAGQQYRLGNLLADILRPDIRRRGVVARPDQEDRWCPSNGQGLVGPRQLWPERAVDAVPLVPRTKEGRHPDDLATHRVRGQNLSWRGRVLDAGGCGKCPVDEIPVGARGAALSEVVRDREHL